ncbi:MAG: haloacid dehalogenase type II [Caldilineae bacterium]|nr:MAG: haloacid dehalogenase type II [Caldilineae bacterium]
MDASTIRALTFDVFGTVVDWRGSIIAEGEAWRPEVDWAGLADAWRAGYQPAMQRVRSGALPWTKIDDLNRMILDDLRPRFGLEELTDEEVDHLNRVWHRLQPWPDAVEGLTRLRERFIVATLSNGNVSLLVNMAKQAGLPWDCILSAELAHHYKPDPEVYLKACRLLDLLPEQVMMVAAHEADLQAAARVGMATAYVHRPRENGPDRPKPWPQETFDIMAQDFVDLAQQLGASPGG